MMNLIRKLNRESFTYLILSIAVWVYIWLRAIYVPLIYDEIATFFHYIHTHSFLPFQAHPDANNHLLNSALSWICYQLLGSSPWVLRLPNTLVFPMYAWFVFLLSRHINHPWLRWMFILSLLFAHNFIEFFALTRGYGISMAFLMATCWFLLKIQRKFTIRDYSWALVFIVFSVAANLNLMYTLLLVLIIPVFNLVSQKSLQTTLFRFRYVISTLLLGCIPAVFFILYLLMLNKQGALYYGSSGGLFGATIGSLDQLLFKEDSPVIFIYSLLLQLAVIAVYFHMQFFHAPQRKWLDHRFLFLFLLAGNFFAGWLVHLIFGINYHEARTALYLYPLLICAVVFTADALISRPKKPFIIILLAPLMLLPVHFIRNINVSHVSFENERIPRRFYKTVRSNQDPNGYPYTIGGYRGREMQWAYWNFREGGKAGVVQSTDYPGYLADYQIVDIRENPAWTEVYDSVDYDPQTYFYLLRRKHFAERLRITDFQVDPIKEVTTEEFISLGNGPADSLTGMSLYAGYRLSLYSPAKPLRVWIVFTVFDTDRQVLRYERIPLDWLRTGWTGEENNLVNGLYIHQLPENAHTFVTYLWNIEKVPLQIRDGGYELFELKENPPLHTFKRREGG